ncbi:MAG TPA: trypsin-like peptidase domain-containing protein [Verrucomicrobiae bacterium]|nr:trypsin-like peptidase domain-containing protein [Verrucomicrobiae bacterium]
MKPFWCLAPVLFLDVVSGFGQAPPSRGAPRTLTDLSTAVESVAKSASPSVVQITVRALAPLEDDETRTGFLANQQATGSGVILDPEGYIITNNHVVDNALKIDISVAAPNQPDGDDHQHYVGKIVGVDRDSDLALIKIDAKNLPTLPFCDSGQLKQGQLVIAVGSPLGLENTLTVGYVSAPVRHLRADQPMFYVQTDAAINPGNSGGPLLDTSGQIVGINTLILTQSGGSEGIGFAIPASVVQRVYKELRANGRVRRGVIGVVPQDLTPTLASALGLQHHSGAILSDIVPHGAAEAAGLAPGDIVLSVDGKPIKAARQLTAAVFQHTSGDQVTLEIERGGQRMQKTVAVLEAPNSPGGLNELAHRNPHLVRQIGILALTLDEHVTDIMTDLRRLSGVVVAAVPLEFAALNPGLVTGDAIYEVNGSRVASVEDLEKTLAAKKPGDPIAMQVERSGRLIYVAFELQ